MRRRRGVAELLPRALRVPRAYAFSAAGTTMTTTRTSSSLSASTSSSSSSSSLVLWRNNKNKVGVVSLSQKGRRRRGVSSTSSSVMDDARWKPHQPVQSKRPAHAPSDTPHTKKWLDSDASKAPIDWISEVQPIGVNGSKVNCHSPGACKERFGEGAALGAPATFYTLADTSVENPAKCKYCGLRFYSLEGSH